MTWEQLSALTLTAEWQYTPVIQPSLGYFRVKHSTTGIYSKLLIAQAQTITAQPVDLWDFKTTFAKVEADLFEFVSPPFFTDRRLGFKIIRSSGMLAPWIVQIEVNTMPLVNPVPTTQPSISSVATPTTVASAITSSPLLAANASRKGATIWNASTATLFVDFDAAASLTEYAARLDAGGFYEIPYGFTGAISGIWSAANGNALVREFT